MKIVQEICAQSYWNRNRCNVFPSIRGGDICSACDICAQLYWNSNPCNVLQYINGGYSVRYMCSAILKLKTMQCFSIYRWEDIVQEICVQWYWNTNPCNVFPSISGGVARKAGVKLRRLHAHCLFHKLKDVINGFRDWWRLTTEVHI